MIIHPEFFLQCLHPENPKLFNRDCLSGGIDELGIKRNNYELFMLDYEILFDESKDFL